MKISIHGASGRMGQSIARIASSEGAQIVGAIASPSSKQLGRDVGEVAGIGHLGVAISDDVAAGLLGADVVIDFSRSEALERLLRLAARAKIAVVSGTTRLDQTCENLLVETSQHVPILWSPNMSIGIHVLTKLAAYAARHLGPAFDIEIVETHHGAKIDAPSGTAMRLAEALREARNGNLQGIYGREGNVGPRKSEEIGVLALRGGDVIGDHTVHLLGPTERIELTHRATNRDVFARGALRLAQRICKKPPGRYTMTDVIEG